MFWSRLKITAKWFIEPLIWIVSISFIIGILLIFPSLVDIIILLGKPVIIVLVLLVVGLMLWVWIEWQFIEPYKHYKYNKLNTKGDK